MRAPSRGLATACLFFVVCSLMLPPGSIAGENGDGTDKLLLVGSQVSLLSGDALPMIWVAQADGSRLRPWIPGDSASWSPRGDAIVFSAPGRGGTEDVFILPITARSPINITNSRRAETDPVWSPDASRIAFSVEGGGIAMVDVDSRTVSEARGTEGGGDPSWSEDGLSLVFVRPAGSSRQLFSVAIDGSQIDQLTNDTIDHAAPAWSSDGTRIAFSGATGIGQADLYVFDISERSTTRVTAIEGSELAPAWTQDDTQLYFVHEESSGTSGNVLDTNTLDISRLPTGGTDAVVPQPCPETCSTLSFDSPRNSEMTISVRKTMERAVVRGRIRGAEDAGGVLVTLEELVDGNPKQVDGGWIDLREGRFARRLKRPFSGRCRVRALFPGGMGFLPALSVRRFDCYYSPPASKLGHLQLVRGKSPVSGPGPVRRFKVKVELRTGFDPQAFSDEVQDILYDPRGWGGGGHLGFKKVDSGPADLSIILATPDTVDRLCAPAPTRGRSSCFNVKRAVINLDRWVLGTPPYKNHLRQYRRYLINHEVGHGLGHGHRGCPTDGSPPPVMMQQTGGLQGCGRAWWPPGWEKGLTPGARTQG